MKTLKNEEEQSTKKTLARSAEKAKVSLPGEIIEDIILRLPVKSILRFRTVSKPWHSRISHPSFTKLHFTAAHRTALFISAYDPSTRKQYLVSAPLDGAPLTHLITLDDTHPNHFTVAQHLNGLVCFACVNKDYPEVFVVNPSTRKIFKLPKQDHPRQKGCYMFGFDESKNEHKILILRKSSKSAKLEIMIFSMSDYSWRKIHVEPPIIGFDWDNLVRHYVYGYYYSVCVNSVVHLMLQKSYDILGFDLITEKFLIIKTPQGVAPHEYDTHYSIRCELFFKGNEPCFIKINGCIGVVCHDRVLENNEMHIWILHDYENRVWVREIITFPECWIMLGKPFPVDFINMDEVIFLKNKLFMNIESSVSIYNRKSRCFKDLQFTLGHQFPLSTTLEVNQIGGYVESMVPL